MSANLTLDGEDEQRDRDLSDRVDLLQVGRHCCILVDSDRTSAEAPDRPGVVRLREAASSSRTGHFIVFDDVRTIENLVPIDVLASAISEAHPRLQFVPPADRGPFDDPFHGLQTAAGRRSFPDKVKIAQAVIANSSDMSWPTIVTKRADQIAGWIRSANGARQAVVAAADADL